MKKNSLIILNNTRDIVKYLYKTQSLSLEIKFLSSCGYYNFLNNSRKNIVRNVTTIKTTNNDTKGLNPIFKREIPHNDLHERKAKDRISIFLNYDFSTQRNETLKLLSDNLTENKRYLCHIKVGYIEETEFVGKLDYKMCGSQFALYTEEGTECFNKLIDNVQDLLDIFYEIYKINPFQCELIQLVFSPVNLRIYNELKASEEMLASQPLNVRKSLLTIPLSINEDYLGPKLITNKDNNGIITNIWSRKKEDLLVDILRQSSPLKENNPDKIKQFKDNWRFYSINNDDKEYTLGVNILSVNRIEKILFNKSGSVILHVFDEILPSNDVLRVRGNNKFYFKANELYLNEVKQNLVAIPQKRIPTEYTSDFNIGALDTETFQNSKGDREIYCLGYKSYPDISRGENNPKVWYVTDFDNDSNKMIIDFINTIMSSKYSDTIFYCHNWGGYDVIYIIYQIFKYNRDVKNLFELSYQFRDNKILKLIIKNIETNKKVTLSDSYSILNNKLEDLVKNFGLSENKLPFPYDFSKEENLQYVGKTPDINWFNKKISAEEYKSMYTENWSFREESLKYLSSDINILYAVLNKASRQMFLDYNVGIKTRSTISSLASFLFMKKYYKHNIPLINKASMYNDIRKGYYGGITEVYRPYGENLYYYDVNSLYPYVALNAMPGVEDCVKFDYREGVDLGDDFGFFYCKIETPENAYLGLLPVRNKGGTIFPLGKYEGWYFSEELKFAKENGYTIKVLKGYKFNKAYSVFEKYVTDIYNIKANAANETQKSIAKSFLNNLLGRFGISLFKPITRIVGSDTFDRIYMTHSVSQYLDLDDKNILITYDPSVNVELIKANNLDIRKVFQNSPEELTAFDMTSVVISAAVTAYGRIFMSKLKLDVLNFGGEIYYSDTDSLVTNMKLPENLVNSKEIGKLKLEHEIKRAIFISGKTYCLHTKEDKYVTIAKSVNAKELSWENYEKMLNNESIRVGKTSSKTFWDKGYVDINQLTVKLDGSVYSKRLKILDKNEKWINTKPLNVLEPTNEQLNMNINHPKPENLNSSFNFIVLMHMLLYLVCSLSYIFYIGYYLLWGFDFDPIYLNECETSIADQIFLLHKDLPDLEVEIPQPRLLDLIENDTVYYPDQTIYIKNVQDITAQNYYIGITENEPLKLDTDYSISPTSIMSSVSKYFSWGSPIPQEIVQEVDPSPVAWSGAPPVIQNHIIAFYSQILEAFMPEAEAIIVPTENMNNIEIIVEEKLTNDNHAVLYIPKDDINYSTNNPFRIPSILVIADNSLELYDNPEGFSFHYCERIERLLDVGSTSDNEETPISFKKNEIWMEEEDSFDLDKLFQEEKQSNEKLVKKCSLETIYESYEQ